MRAPSILVALLLCSGCRASVSVEAKAKAEEPEESYAEPAVREKVAEHREPALLGARTDVTPNPDRAQRGCSCLLVAVGDPRSGNFRWDSEAPSTDPTTQFVVALTSAGAPCGTAPPRPASYRGYQRRGDDVVVQVELARPGEAPTEGAIVPRPTGSGSLWLEPHAKGVPFGRGPGGGACRVELPPLPK